MRQDFLALVRTYQKRGVFIDTNLLILYIVGSLDPKQIGRHKRTADYSFDDYDRLSKFVDDFDVRVVSPNVLTETSNLLGRNASLREVLREFIMTAKDASRRSSLTASNPYFILCGLTDAGILEVSQNRYLVATDDGPLEGHLRNAGVDVVNLDDLRQI
ncbi:MAG TPA: hypothetical protein PLR83_07480 [Pyrinomonadaceae bacterium]|nr:hypothetical protein [Pyrinomonadaceae bacterium]